MNLYHLRARYYNMLAGRFETMDPYEGDTSDPTTLHRYVYTANNPVNRIDPSGKADIEEESVLNAKSFTVFRQGFSAWRQRLAAACEDRVDQWILEQGRLFSRDEVIVG